MRCRDSQALIERVLFIWLIQLYVGYNWMSRSRQSRQDTTVRVSDHKVSVIAL